MVVSYNGLWKSLIDKNMKKMDLVQKVGISTSTLAKMGKGEPVSLEVLGRSAISSTAILDTLLISPGANRGRIHNGSLCIS